MMGLALIVLLRFPSLLGLSLIPYYFQVASVRVQQRLLQHFISFHQSLTGVCFNNVYNVSRKLSFVPLCLLLCFSTGKC